MIDVDWIALDWGTTNLRGWAIGADGAVLAEAQSDRGMGTLAPHDFEPAVLDLINGWIDGPITALACGMVGAKQGWTEAAYARVPCAVIPDDFTTAPTKTPGLSVQIIPGLSQAKPADVMRGEETQIAGFLARNPGWDGVLCLPGTHTKWVHISAGEVVSFQTMMTGDLFAAIAGHTVLRHSVAPRGWDDGAFETAIDAALSRPERMAGRLFSLRAEGLLAGMDAATARARLSGTLIGAELAATKPYWLGQQIGIIGAGHLADIYAKALATQGVIAQIADNTDVTLVGLKAAYAKWKDRQ